jgi:hypothetical protein
MYTDMDANQSVQDGREGEAEDVVEDGEGGGSVIGGGRDGFSCFGGWKGRCI